MEQYVQMHSCVHPFVTDFQIDSQAPGSCNKLQISPVVHYFSREKFDFCLTQERAKDMCDPKPQDQSDR
jgi:hypothetical protein